MGFKTKRASSSGGVQSTFVCFFGSLITFGDESILEANAKREKKEGKEGKRRGGFCSPSWGMPGDRDTYLQAEIP